MDELWKERQDFKVCTTLKEMGKPYTKYIAAADRKVYLNQLSKALLVWVLSKVIRV